MRDCAGGNISMDSILNAFRERMEDTGIGADFEGRTW